MNFVWIIMRSFPYEGADILGVFSSKIKAERVAKIKGWKLIGPETHTGMNDFYFIQREKIDPKLS